MLYIVLAVTSYEVLIVMMGTLSWLNDQLMQYHTHLDHYNFPPKVWSMCVELCVTDWSLLATVSSKLVFQSLVYCRFSSTYILIMFFHLMLPSRLMTLQPLFCFSKVLIIGELIYTQWVPEDPEPWQAPCIGGMRSVCISFGKWQEQFLLDILYCVRY